MDISIFIVLALAAAWFVQILLSSYQMLRFHRKNQEMRKLGTHMATGVAGTTYRRKTYATVVTDENNRVSAAGRLAGFTVGAGMRPVDEVIGLHVDQVGEGPSPAGVKQKTWDALGHAAGFIRTKLAKEAAEDAAGEVADDTAVGGVADSLPPESDVEDTKNAESISEREDP